PAVAGADVHVLDQAQDVARAAEVLRHLEDASVVEPALHHHVHLDRPEPGRGRGIDALEHPGRRDADVVDRCEDVVVQRVEADRHAVQAGVGQPLRLPRQEDAVRRQRDVLDARHGGEHPRQPLDLLERQDLGAAQELEVVAEDLLRHAVHAAEVAPVGDRDAQIAQRPGQCVGDGIHVCSLPVRRLRHTMIDRILDLLRERYGPPSLHRRLPPLDELVLTILSQNTSDINCERAYASLRARFPEWADVRDADTADVEAVLRPGGLAAQKAPRIQAVLRELSDAGPPRLDWAAELAPAAAMARLVAMPGVGPKTASCVLLFSLDVPVMPVDTHVGRVARRLGLIPERMADGPAHAALTALVPDTRMLEAHLLFITHGRRTCIARRPRCGECPLLDLCPYGRSVAPSG